MLRRSAQSTLRNRVGRADRRAQGARWSELPSDAAVRMRSMLGKESLGSEAGKLWYDDFSSGSQMESDHNVKGLRVTITCPLRETKV